MCSLAGEQPGRVVLGGLCSAQDTTGPRRTGILLSFLLAKTVKLQVHLVGKYIMQSGRTYGEGWEKKEFKEKPGVPGVCSQTGLSKGSSVASGSTSSSEMSQCWVPLPFIQNRNWG